MEPLPKSRRRFARSAALRRGDSHSGRDRRQQDQGKALAGKSMLNRLELTPVGADTKSRYKKITAHHRQIEDLFVELFLQAHREPPEQIVLPLDATDDPVHGPLSLGHHPNRSNPAQNQHR